MCTLTQEQTDLINELENFIQDPEQKYFIIDAPAGTGKTYITNYFFNKIYLPKYSNKYNFILTATTNKATSVLATRVPECNYVSTIHKAFNIRVYNDLTTGKQILQPAKGYYNLIYQTIIIIDECSMIDNNLLDIILQNCKNCKLIFMGDKKQLPPVKLKISPVFNLPVKQTYTLTKIMRNNTHQELMNICNQLRENVDSLSFKDINITGNIIYCDGVSFQNAVNKYFNEPTCNSRILTYTNKKAIAYTEYIYKLRGYSEYYNVNEYYTNASTFVHNPFIKNNTKLVTTDSILKIINIDNTIKTDLATNIKYKVFTLQLVSPDINFSNTSITAFIPVSREEYKQALSKFAKEKNWKNYFYLLEYFADLRYTDASTVHKAQGMTIDNIFIDLSDLGTCTHKDIFAKLMYVAFSRAKENIFLYGKLPERFGHIITS